MRLQAKTSELEDSRRKLADENEDKNRRIGHLHAELKELQDRLNDQNVKNSLLDSKTQDMLGNYERVSNENNDNISRLKIENDRLTGENVDLLSKISKISNELDSFRVGDEKNQYQNNFNRSKIEGDLEALENRLRDASGANNNLDIELKRACKEKYEQECQYKDERAELDHKISDCNFNLAKAENENAEINQKLENTNNLYSEAYKDNEKILRDFEEFKRHQSGVNNTKDNDINGLKTGT